MEAARDPEKRGQMLRETNLADLFQSTYVINLQERSDRRREMITELEKAGMPLAPGRVEIFKAVRPKEAGGFPSIGARGGFLSHLNVLKTAMERKLRNVLIFEDDLAISPKLEQNLSSIAARLEAEPWGVFYLGHYLQNVSSLKLVAGSDIVRLVPFNQPVQGTHFYAVNGPVIPRLLEYLEQVQRREPGDPLGGPMYSDSAVDMFRGANPDIRTLLVYPSLGFQRPSRSDISPKWYERFTLGRHASDLARSIRGRLRTESSS
jgi:glycosyl transferase family 25